MFNVGGGEVLVILLVALIVLGPTKLPEAARQIGAVLTQVRQMSSGFQNELRSAMDETISPRSAPAVPAVGDAAPDPHGGSDPIGDPPSGGPAHDGTDAGGGDEADGAARPASTVSDPPPGVGGSGAAHDDRPTG